MTFILTTGSLMAVSIFLIYHLCRFIGIEMKWVSLVLCAFMAFLVNVTAISMSPFLTRSHYLRLGILVIAAAAFVTFFNERLLQREEKKAAEEEISPLAGSSEQPALAAACPADISMQELPDYSTAADCSTQTDSEEPPEQKTEPKAEQKIEPKTTEASHKSEAESLPAASSAQIEEKAEKAAKARVAAKAEALAKAKSLQEEKQAAEERKARQEAEQKAKEAAQQKAREEAAAKAREAAQQKAQEEAAAKAREAAQQKAREEAAAKAKEAAQQKAREKAAAKAREAAQQKAREEAAAKAREAAQQKAREEAAAKAKKAKRAAIQQELTALDSLDSLLDYAYDHAESSPEASICAYQQAIARYPDDSYTPFLVIELGNLYKGQAAYAKAIETYRQAKSIPIIAANDAMKQEFIKNTRYLVIVQNILSKHHALSTPFPDIPADIMQEIETEFQKSS